MLLHYPSLLGPKTPRPSGSYSYPFPGDTAYCFSQYYPCPAPTAFLLELSHMSYPVKLPGDIHRIRTHVLLA